MRLLFACCEQFECCVVVGPSVAEFVGHKHDIQYVHFCDSFSSWFNIILGSWIGSSSLMRRLGGCFYCFVPKDAEAIPTSLINLLDAHARCILPPSPVSHIWLYPKWSQWDLNRYCKPLSKYKWKVGTCQDTPKKTTVGLITDHCQFRIAFCPLLDNDGHIRLFLVAITWYCELCIYIVHQQRKHSSTRAALWGKQRRKFVQWLQDVDS